MPVVTDCKGVVLEVGDRVRVFQSSEVSLATIKELTDSPTLNASGWWVDIEKDDLNGIEGMPSYLLEKLDPDEYKLSA